MSEKALTQKSAEVTAIQTPDNLLAIAVQNGADVDQLSKLMDLKERYEAGEAKKSFFHALTDFQSKMPSIKRTSTVAFDNTKYSFASLGAIAEQIRDSLKECGLSYRFSQNHENDIQVTCIVTHVDGHSESTSMTAPADTSGRKNNIQGIGSTVTYLQRYTLISALGLTTADDDVDAKVAIATGKTLDINQITLIENMLQTQKRDANKFLNWIGVSRMKDIPSKDWGKICAALGIDGQ
jgi:hypothetical protein